MKRFGAAIAVGLIGLAGCRSPAPESSVAGAPANAAPSLPATAASRKSNTATSKVPLVVPDTSLRGKVSRCNEAGRFMVLEFPVSRLPAIGQTLLVYRHGLKVGEAKVTGPQRDDRTVADLVNGEAQVGDEVREQ